VHVYFAHHRIKSDACYVFCELFSREMQQLQIQTCVCDAAAVYFLSVIHNSFKTHTCAKIGRRANDWASNGLGDRAAAIPRTKALEGTDEWRQFSRSHCPGRAGLVIVPVTLCSNHVDGR